MKPSIRLLGAVLLSLGIVMPGLAGCSTSPSEPLSQATCEEKRESRANQRDDGVLNAQDLQELRLDGC